MPGTARRKVVISCLELKVVFCRGETPTFCMAHLHAYSYAICQKTQKVPKYVGTVLVSLFGLVGHCVGLVLSVALAQGLCTV